MKLYTCAICKKHIDTETKQPSKTVHDHYVNCLANWFETKGYKIVVVWRGGIPSAKGWAAPDLFLLKDSFLKKIVEVVCGDSYEDDKRPDNPRAVINKCKKIQSYYSPSEIIIFEPLEFLDVEYLTSNRKTYYKRSLGLLMEPVSYRQIGAEYAKRWKTKGLAVTFWNENNLRVD